MSCLVLTKDADVFCVQIMYNDFCFQDIDVKSDDKLQLEPVVLLERINVTQLGFVFDEISSHFASTESYKQIIYLLIDLKKQDAKMTSFQSESQPPIV